MRMVRNRPVQCLLTASLLAAPFVSGCATPDPEPTTVEKSMGVRPVTVQPAWRQFALDNIDGYIYAELKAQPDVRLIGEPDVSASRSSAGGPVMMTVIGNVDADRLTGQRYRRKYFVVWRQEGNGWVHVMTRIDAGKLAPVIKDGKTGSKPVTKPTAPPPTP